MFIFPLSYNLNKEQKMFKSKVANTSKRCLQKQQWLITLIYLCTMLVPTTVSLGSEQKLYIHSGQHFKTEKFVIKFGDFPSIKFNSQSYFLLIS